jgi:hypothetical protein
MSRIGIRSIKFSSTANSLVFAADQLPMSVPGPHAPVLSPFISSLPISQEQRRPSIAPQMQSGCVLDPTLQLTPLLYTEFKL